MKNKNNHQSGYGKIDIFLGVVAVILIGLIVWIVVSHVHTTVKTTTSKTSTQAKTKFNFNPKDEYAMLSPAATLSKKAECYQAVTTGQDGNPTPVTCTNGDLNIAEWQALEKIYPANVMELYPSASQITITKTVCMDLGSGKTSIPIEDSAYHIAALYYGWTYQSSLVQKDKC